MSGRRGGYRCLVTDLKGGSRIPRRRAPTLHFATISKNHMELRNFIRTGRVRVNTGFGQGERNLTSQNLKYHLGSFRNLLLAVADLKRHPRYHANFSQCHAVFFGKLGKIVCWRPPSCRLAPLPTQNPGSAPVLGLIIVFVDTRNALGSILDPHVLNSHLPTNTT